MQTALSLAIEQFGHRLPMDFYGSVFSPGGPIGPGPMVPDPNNPFLAGQGAGAGTNPLGQVNYAGPANANFNDPTVRPGAQGNNIGQIGGTFASNVFTPFDFNNDVLSDVQEEVTRGLFSGNTGIWSFRRLRFQRFDRKS